MPKLKYIRLLTDYFGKEGDFHFSLQASSTAALFCSLLPRDALTEAAQLNIFIERNFAGEPFYLFAKPLGICIYRANINIADFFALSSHLKKVRILEVIAECINHIERLGAVEGGPFRVAAQRVKDVDYVRQWMLHKPKISRDRELAASAYLKHEVDAFEVRISVENRSGVRVHEEVILSVPPDEYTFQEYFGKLTWGDERRLAFQDVKGNEIWSKRF